MLFNSWSYALFLPFVYVLYWLILSKNLKLQNLFLLVASYFFYGCWDWRFMLLLAFSTAIDFFAGLQIHNASTEIRRKTWLWASVCINVGLLGYFKYFNFFLDSFSTLLLSTGIQANLPTLQLILPVGISFYTFHGLSYLFDIYNKKSAPTDNIIDYALFVSFFPLLVAGPIERASNLLVQVMTPRRFNPLHASDGLRQIIWGIFKKIVIADNCAEYANILFNPTAQYAASAYWLGALFFSFQIYGDFSGYSDIALGSARLLGFDLKKNFAFPYFSRDIAEFWRRWNISLSTWFKDYIYIPLGGSKTSLTTSIRNTFIIFLISGFWHGANWTFIIWGTLHAFLFIPLLLMNKNRSNLGTVAQGKNLPTLNEVFSIGVTFTMVTLLWIIFRAENLNHALQYYSNLFSPTLFSNPFAYPDLRKSPIILCLMLFFIGVEWIGRENEYAIEKIALKSHVLLRWTWYAFLILIIGLYAQTNETPFIYFQF